MKLYGYGEDGMTLWALTNDLGEILSQLKDTTPPGDCLAFYRPSFGRASARGGHAFGEPDFVVCTQQAVYIGEAKWHASTEWTRRRTESRFRLDLGDLDNRQDTLCFYIRQWLKMRPKDWKEFRAGLRSKDWPDGHVPPEDKTRLADTLETVLGLVADYYRDRPDNVEVHNLALYVHDKAEDKPEWNVQPKSEWKTATVCCRRACVGRGPGHDGHERGLIELA